MILQKIIKEYEKKVPLSLAYNWDNVGLLIGDNNKEIKKIMTTLEITDISLKEAIKKEVDLIFTHHPIMFSKINKIIKDDLEGRKIIELIKNDIAVYASHTNLDIVENGLNDYMIKKMNLDIKEILIEENEPIRTIILNREYNFFEIIDMIKLTFNLENIRFVNRKEKINSISIVTGSGLDFIPYVLKNNVDLFITGDITHHKALDAKELGISLIEIDHFTFEKEVSTLMKEILENITENVEIIESKEIEKVFEMI